MTFSQLFGHFAKIVQSIKEVLYESQKINHCQKKVRNIAHGSESKSCKNQERCTAKGS